MLKLGMVLVIIITFFILIIIILFSFPKFSPIPYFPSNKKDLPLIIKGLSLKNNQTVIDLGAGDGIVVFEAAKNAYENKLNTKFVAVDINPILLLIMHIRHLFHSNKKNIKIMYANMFSIDCQTFKLSNFITFYLYISPWYLEKVISNLKFQISNFSIVSYMYKIKSLKANKTINGNKHDVFVYNI